MTVLCDRRQRCALATSAALIMFLSGCQTPMLGPVPVDLLTGPGSEVDTGVRLHQQWLIPIGIAEGLAQRCRAVQVNRAARSGTLADLRAELEAQGYSRPEAQEVVMSVDRRARKSAFAAYARASGLNLREASTICAAARREIAARSSIGRYLNPV